MSNVKRKQYRFQLPEKESAWLRAGNIELLKKGFKQVRTYKDEFDREFEQSVEFKNLEIISMSTFNGVVTVLTEAEAHYGTIEPATAKEN